MGIWSCIVILFVLANHFFADFILQSHNMATLKSKSNYWLTLHILAYTAGMIPTALLLWLGSQSFIIAFIWLIVNGAAHWITDYNTSRWTSKLYAKQEFHKFFCVIGFDQLIHYTCLFGTITYFT